MNRIIIFLTAVLLFSCSANKGLVRLPDVPFDPHGGQIFITTLDGKYIEGELISVGAKRLLVLPWNGAAEYVNLAEIRKYDLKTADTRKLDSRPASMGLIALHGVFGIITLPINLVSFGLLQSQKGSISGGHEGNLTYDTLKMYARFPQGLPRNLDLSALKTRSREKIPQRQSTAVKQKKVRNLP